MLKNSRVTGGLDVSRLGEAIARPGIDTRTWVTLAIVTAVHVDSNEGVFVDVFTMPNREAWTARLGVEYAGNGFGLYAPVMVDDEVLVEAPNGDPEQGLIVTRRLHSASDPPPSEVSDHPEDVLLVVRAGKTVRVLVSGEGKVVLGDADADDPVALKSDLEEIKPAIIAGIDGQIAALTPGLPGTAGEIARLTELRNRIELTWPRCSTKVVAV